MLLDVATVRNRSQSSAGIRVRAVWPCLWRVLQKLPLSFIFDGSKHRVASFRMGGVALRDIQTRFISEVGLCRPTLLRRFQKMSCSFSGRRSA